MDSSVRASSENKRFSLDLQSRLANAEEIATRLHAENIELKTKIRNIQELVVEADRQIGEVKVFKKETKFRFKEYEESSRRSSSKCTRPGRRNASGCGGLEPRIICWSSKSL